MNSANSSMHYVLATIGSAGDVNPMMALGKGLQARGHRVTIVTSPYFAEYVRAGGLDFHGVGSVEEHKRLVDDPDLWHPRRGLQTIAAGGLLPLTRPVYDFLATCNPAETVVVSSALVFGAGLAREKLGLRHVVLHLQPSLLRSAGDPPVLGGLALPEWLPPRAVHAYYGLIDRLVIDPIFAGALNEIRAELDLPPVQNVFGDPLHSPLLNLCLFPAWFAPPQPDWPANTRLTGFLAYDAGDQQPVAPELEAFIVAGAPPLIFTPGTANIHAADFFRQSLTAVCMLGRRAVFLTTHPEHVPDNLPASILHCDYAPFGQVLPRAAALIHHGGIGTMAQAFNAGIPQLVMPMSHDQPDNAARAQRLGVAEVVPPGRYRAGAVAGKLARLVDSLDVQARCREIAAQVDFQAGLAAACDALEAVTPREV